MTPIPRAFTGPLCRPGPGWPVGVLGAVRPRPCPARRCVWSLLGWGEAGPEAAGSCSRGPQSPPPLPAHGCTSCARGNNSKKLSASSYTFVRVARGVTPGALCVCFTPTAVPRALPGLRAFLNFPAGGDGGGAGGVVRRQVGERLAWGAVWGPQAPGVRGGQRDFFTPRPRSRTCLLDSPQVPLSWASPLGRPGQIGGLGSPRAGPCHV